jgi:hypothetical protein
VKTDLELVIEALKPCLVEEDGIACRNPECMARAVLRALEPSIKAQLAKSRRWERNRVLADVGVVLGAKAVKRMEMWPPYEYKIEGEDT